MYIGVEGKDLRKDGQLSGDEIQAEYVSI